MRGEMGDAVEEDLLLNDLEGLLREISEFSTGGGSSAANNKAEEEVPPSLERYLKYVAMTGNTVFPWNHVRNLFRCKILQAMEEFPGEVCPSIEAFVMERFDLFRAAPFTIQRLAELVIKPTVHYKKKDKFLRGLEKTVLVVSTVEPWSLDADLKNGNDSASDSDMEQTFSESDEASLNRTFQLPRENLLLSSNGPILQDHAIIDVGSGPVETTACIPVATEVSVFSEMTPITDSGYSETETGLSHTYEALSQEGSIINETKDNNVHVECGSEETTTACLPVATEVSVFSEMTPLTDTETFSEAESRTYETLSHDGPIMSEKEGVGNVNAECGTDDTIPVDAEISVFPELTPITDAETGFPEAENPTFESLSHEASTVSVCDTETSGSGNANANNVECAPGVNSALLLEAAAVPAGELLTTLPSAVVEAEEVKTVNGSVEMESDP